MLIVLVVIFMAIIVVATGKKVSTKDTKRNATFSVKN
jgi:hypothetical protein